MSEVRTVKLVTEALESAGLQVSTFQFFGRTVLDVHDADLASVATITIEEER